MRYSSNHTLIVVAVSLWVFAGTYRMSSAEQAAPTGLDDIQLAQSETAATLFDHVWQTFDSGYSYFAHKGVDWDAVRERHRASFDRPMTPVEFANQLATVLRELQDRHVNVRTPDGAYVDVFPHNWDRNFTSRPRNRYTMSGYETLGGEVIWHALLIGNVAYIRVDTLENGAFAGIGAADIDALFARYAAARGMIIDIRPNAGGNEDLAMLFASHLTDEPREYGAIAFRDGPGRGDLGPRQTKVLTPSASNHFSGPVIGLIGPRNMSSAEWFALMMEACPNVMLVGAQTAGSSGNPAWHTLSNGVSYSVPRWVAYRPDGNILEGLGVEPDVLISPTQSFDGSSDFVVERALQLFSE